MSGDNMVRLLGRNSPQFQRYLNEQTTERVNEIMAAERAYSASRRFAGENPEERAYEESMIGFNDNAAGTYIRYRDDPNSGGVFSKRLDDR